MKTYPFEIYEPEIGEKFQFSDDNMTVYKCIEDKEMCLDRCCKCAFFETIGWDEGNINRYCHHVRCDGIDDYHPRKDGKFVHFVRVIE